MKKTENELNIEIQDIRAKLQKEHPALFNYLNDMPVRILELNKLGTNSKKSEEYRDSLKELLKHYSKKNDYKKNIHR